MKWVTLYKKIGKQPISKTNHQNVYALLDLNDGLGIRQVPLTLKFDKTGSPYLIQDLSIKEKE